MQVLPAGASILWTKTEASQRITYNLKAVMRGCNERLLSLSSEGYGEIQ